MPSVDINWLAVLAAAAVNMVVGFVWYAPQLFGKTWQRLVGLSDKDMKDADKVTPMVAMVILAVVEAFVLSHFITYSAFFYGGDYSETTIGLLTGLWVWVGFVVPVMGGSYLFAQRRKKLLAIDAGYQLIVLPIAGIILATWH